MSDAPRTPSGRSPVEHIAALIDDIRDPCSIANGDPLGLGEMGLVESIEIADDGLVKVRMRLTSPTCVMVGLFKSEIENRLSALPDVRQVEITFDHGLDWHPDMMSADARQRRAARLADLHRRQAGGLAAAA